MSIIANAFLDIAKSFANMTNSVLKIRIKQDSINYSFGEKSSNEKEVYEGHYGNVEIYLGDMANPIKLDLEPEDYGKHRVVDVLDNAVSTKYYSTFMQQEAIERMFSITGPKTEKVMQLLYVTLAGLAIILVMQVAMFG